MKTSYKIILAIQNNELTTNNDVAEVLGMKEQYTTVSRQLKKLRQQDFVKVEQDKYKLTPLGKKTARAINDLAEVNFVELYNRESK